MVALTLDGVGSIPSWHIAALDPTRVIEHLVYVDDPRNGFRMALRIVQREVIMVV